MPHPAWNVARQQGDLMFHKTAVTDFVKALNERRKTTSAVWNDIILDDYPGQMANVGGFAPKFGYQYSDPFLGPQWFLGWWPFNRDWGGTRFGSSPDPWNFPAGPTYTWAQIQYMTTYLAFETVERDKPISDWHGTDRNDIVTYIEDTRIYINAHFMPDFRPITQSELGSDQVQPDVVAAIWRYPHSWPPPSGYVREWTRQIHSLSDSGSSGQIAEFTVQNLGFPGFPEPGDTPADQWKHGGKIFTYGTSGWELAASTLTSGDVDILSDYGPVQDEDAISAAFVNSIMDAINNLQRPILSWGPTATAGEKVSDNGTAQDFCGPGTTWNDLSYDPDALADFAATTGDHLFPVDPADWDPGDWDVYQFAYRYTWETECFPGDPSTYHLGDTNVARTSDFRVLIFSPNFEERTRKFYCFGAAADFYPSPTPNAYSYEWDDNGMPALPGALVWVAPDYGQVTSPSGFTPLYGLTLMHISALMADETYETVDFVGGGNTPITAAPVTEPPISRPFDIGEFHIAYRGWNLLSIAGSVVADYEQSGGYIYQFGTTPPAPP